MSSNRGAEKPTLKYSRSSPFFHNSSWYLVKMRPSTSAGDVSPCFTGQIQVKSIVSEFKDSGSNSPLREWSCPGMISTGSKQWTRGKAGHTPFIPRDKWYISQEGNKEIRTTREGWIGC